MIIGIDHIFTFLKKSENLYQDMKYYSGHLLQIKILNKLIFYFKKKIKIEKILQRHQKESLKKDLEPKILF